ncbi:undecaprenyldiphospho-muramoylpentapeptide beta-N-acetylglucosaminyltransferase [soil metagenome]
MMKVLFAAGGTGGHIFPAISIADELRKKVSDTEILFVGAKDRIEEKIVPHNGYKLETIRLTGFDREKFFKNAGLPFKIVGSLRKCFLILKKFKPDVVIGTGGFVCGPLVYAAGIMRIPTVIQEGNEYPGKTIKFLAPRSDLVIINFDGTRKYLRTKAEIMKISHPIRKNLVLTDKKDAVEIFGLNANLKTLFVFGGSQGARGINQAIEEITEKLYDDNINLIWQAGQNDAERLSEKFRSKSDKIKILKFIDNMSAAYSACNLIVCRAGITSIMEIAYLKIPAILIPLPTSAENHQELNARSVEKANGVEVILQKDLNDKLYLKIKMLMNDEKKLTDLSENVSKFSDINAASKIADKIINIFKINERKNL